MKNRAAAPALCGIILALSYGLGSCNKSTARSSSIKCGEHCADYQHTDSLPDQPPQGVLRLAIGGDSRNDESHVVPWAFGKAKERAAKAFFFLGDMEITSLEDKRFAKQVDEGLNGISFYPVIGNHEVLFMGIARLPDTRAKVKRFKESFLKLSVNHAPGEDEVVYSVDVENRVHFIALDNVSLKSVGFSQEQLEWLEKDLIAANGAKRTILVGMHKGLAGNPVTKHAMDEDKGAAVHSSDAALALFKKYGVAMVFVSHSHMYASYNQDGVEVRLTGGLGAPLVQGLAPGDGGFHHFLLVDVPPGDSKTPLRVEVVKFPGKSVMDDKDETDEID